MTALLNGASVVIPAVLAWFGQFAGGLGTIVQAAKTIFQGLLTFLSGVFTGRWSSIWQGIRQIFSGAFSGLAALVKDPNQRRDRPDQQGHFRDQRPGN